jgi:hypothetical protein
VETNWWVKWLTFLEHDRQSADNPYKEAENVNLLPVVQPLKIQLIIPLYQFELIIQLLQCILIRPDRVRCEINIKALPS